MKKILSLLLLSQALTVVAANGTDPVWRASRQAIYEPGATASSWVLDVESTFEYSPEGLPLVENRSDSTRLTTVYDEAGRWISELSESILPDGSTAPFKRRTRAYDAQTGLIIESREIIIQDEEEREGNSYRRTVTRDSLGRITQVELAVPYGGAFDPIERLVIEYGADGNATTITQQVLTAVTQTEFEWLTGEVYSNILWDCTDHQITSAADLFRGANRIVSARYTNTSGGKPYYDYSIRATYGDNGKDFTSSFTGLYQGIDSAGVSRTYAVKTNADGSSQERLDTRYYTRGPNGEMIDPENYIDLAKYDAHGNETLVEQRYWGNDSAGVYFEELIHQVKTTLKYDATSGHLTRSTARAYNPDTKRLENMMRIDFSDYIDCAAPNALPALPAEPANGPAAFFDLHGRRIAHPAPGTIVVEQRPGAPARLIRLP